MQDFRPLQGPLYQGLETLARKHGLRGKFVVLLAMRTEEAMRKHEERDGEDWSTRAIALPDGRVLVFPWTWEVHLEEFGPAAVAGEMSNALAEEIGHLIDYEKFPRWGMTLLDWRFRVIRRLKRPLGKLVPRLQPTLLRLYESAYERSFFEKRAKRFASIHEEEYFAVVWPHFINCMKEYLSLSRE